MSIVSGNKSYDCFQRITSYMLL